MSTEEKDAIRAMHREAHQAFKDAAAQVYAELDRTGATFPYLIDGKVIEITTVQLRALTAQTSEATAWNRQEMR